eukprot:CAMPEP_0172888576 /NCGR_PEP_ID=MMETSP1075-20121228/136738_1 /TAXON_ID=2916 /ORGANISM="Ceratium fusus, Strain PA161109" /LENGTH=412 /DNA_ID=CAMNT_0013742475 /DNA_START=319 /DNA_END=1557 /DNA_ORIENTATION=-
MPELQSRRQPTPSPVQPSAASPSRRAALAGAVLAAGGLQLATAPSALAAQDSLQSSASDVAGPLAFKIADFGGLTPATRQAWQADLEQGDVILLGEHHNSVEDHALQLELLRNLAGQSERDGKVLAVGLEMVQKQFQPALDAYTQGGLSDRQLFEQTDWAKRWTWPFELYQPLFQFCRSGKIKLVALNTDAEVLAKVESGGLENLTKEEWQANIPDRVGFSQLGKDPAFKAYLANIVVPSYRLHQRLGILRQTVTGQVLDKDMSLQHFVGGRILWDETMAGSAVKALSELGGPSRARLALLVGNDHVKFRYGILERVRRLAKAAVSGADSGKGDVGSPWQVLSVVCNPRNSDGLLQQDGTPMESLVLEMQVPAAVSQSRTAAATTARPRQVPLADLILLSPDSMDKSGFIPA